MTPNNKHKNKVWIWALTAVVVLLVLLTLAYSTTVAQTIKTMFKNNPEAGNIAQSPIPRGLAEPVTIYREGIRLRVEQVIIDSDETQLAYSTEDINDDGPPCSRRAKLRLPNGVSLSSMSGGGSGSEVTGGHLRNEQAEPGRRPTTWRPLRGRRPRRGGSCRPARAAACRPGCPARTWRESC